MTEFYDVGIIGGGPGGYVAAIRAAQLGLKTALVEKRNTLGGTCLNVGCIPSKALLTSTEHLYFLKHRAKEHGITSGKPVLDLKVMMDRKQQAVEKLTGGIAELMKHNKVDLFFGEGFIQKKGEIIVHRESQENFTIKTASIILATGSRPVEIPFLPFTNNAIIDSTGALELTKFPASMAVVGSGPIGLELGTVWSRCDVKVDVVEIMPEILPGWDKQLSETLKKVLIRQGITFHLSTTISGYRNDQNGIVLEGQDSSGGVVEIPAEKVLVAAGRKPYCPTPIIENLNLEQDQAGRIKVDGGFRTSADSVYAVGDLIQGPMLAHKAEEEGAAVAELIAGKAGHVNYDVIPGVVYTSPEAAAVGKTEEQLKDKGIPYNRGVFRFGANGKAVAAGETDGFVKILAHKETDRLLGVHIIGKEASSLIAEAVTALEFGGSAEDMGRTVHAHPTLSEAMKEAALSAYDRGLHSI
jgi:dihydrolipoamide dehydrogenase